ncbi:hypothetical protein BDFG_09204, partial [Blastomyces dermatitidis ATCC 26199]
FPANVKKMIKIFHRHIVVHNEQIVDEEMKPIIWIAQVGEFSCLSHYETLDQWDHGGVCPRIKLKLVEETNDGETEFDGSYCPLLPRAGPSGHTVGFTNNGGAKSSPTCAPGTRCGGRLCTGFFCSPMPTGVLPDRHDPKDPNASNRVPTTTGPGVPEPVGPYGRCG